MLGSLSHGLGFILELPIEGRLPALPIVLLNAFIWAFIF